MNLRKRIFTHERERRKTETAQKSEINQRISLLPNNPRIKPLGIKGFVMSFANLGNSWSPEYYNFDTQYRMLADLVSLAESPLSALRRIRRALNDRRVVVGRKSVALHPDVVRNARNIFFG